MPTHHDPFGSNVCTDVSWTFWVPPKTSWDVWIWSNVAFRMSKSTVFALPSSVVKASVVTSVSVTEPEISRELDTETEPTICRLKDHVVTPVGHTWRLLKDIVTHLALSAALTAGYGS